MWYQNIRSALFGFVTKHANGQTDEQTNGQNYDSQDRASIAASSDKMMNHSQERRPRWFGHVQRMEESETVKF